MAASDETVRKLIGLSENARHASGHLAEAAEYDAAPIVKWVRVLQRALDSAVQEAYSAIEEDIAVGENDTVDDAVVTTYNSRIWKALSFTARNELRTLFRGP